MTILSKPLRRLSNESHQGRRLIIEVIPGATDLIIIREQGRRKGYAVPVQKIFQLGANIYAQAEIKARKDKRKAKKEAKK